MGQSLRTKSIYRRWKYLTLRHNDCISPIVRHPVQQCKRSGQGDGKSAEDAGGCKSSSCCLFDVEEEDGARSWKPAGVDQQRAGAPGASSCLWRSQGSGGAGSSWTTDLMGLHSL